MTQDTRLARLVAKAVRREREQERRETALRAFSAALKDTPAYRALERMVAWLSRRLP